MRRGFKASYSTRKTRIHVRGAVRNEEVKPLKRSDGRVPPPKKPKR